MTQFEPAWTYLMTWEDPGLTGRVTTDSGGLTRWGISQRAYPDLDIANLTQEEAAAIGRRDYFEPIHGFEIADQRVCSKLFDMAYNMGVHTAVKLCQRACGVAQDGIMGPLTLAAVNAFDPGILLNNLSLEAAKHYEQIAKNTPSEAKYLSGWLRRAEGMPPAQV